MDKNNIAPAKYRLLGGLIDWLIVMVINLWLVLGVVSGITINEVMNSLMSLIVFLIFFSLIFPFINSILISKLGGTIGKLSTGTMIVNSQGQLISFWRAFFRNHIGYMVSGMFFWLGFIWILVDGEHRGWHDQIADTYVTLKNKQSISTNKTGLLIGFTIFIILLVINIYLSMQIINRFDQNLEFYQSVIKNVIEENSPKPTLTPIPVSTLY